MINFIKSKLKQRQQRARDLAALYAMSDRDLADIGISRHDIKRAFYGR